VKLRIDGNIAKEKLFTQSKRRSSATYAWLHAGWTWGHTIEAQTSLLVLQSLSWLVELQCRLLVENLDVSTSNAVFKGVIGAFGEDCNLFAFQAHATYYTDACD
jgi:hypothetical protein